jgi:hypothetical protein
MLPELSVGRTGLYRPSTSPGSIHSINCFAGANSAPRRARILSAQAPNTNGGRVTTQAPNWVSAVFMLNSTNANNSCLQILQVIYDANHSQQYRAIPMASLLTHVSIAALLLGWALFTLIPA